MSQPRRCFLQVGSQRELYEQTAFGKYLRLAYAINRGDLSPVSYGERGRLLGRPRDRLTHSFSSRSADELLPCHLKATLQRAAVNPNLQPTLVLLAIHQLLQHQQPRALLFPQKELFNH